MRTAWRIGAATGAAMVVANAFGSAGLSAQPLSHAGNGAARPDSARRVVRLGLGLGGGAMGEGANAIAGRASLTWSQGRSGAITIRTAAVEEFNLFGPMPSEGVWDLGVLYGRQTHGRWGYASASAGVALVGGMRRGARISAPPTCDGYDMLAGLACALAAALTPVRYEERPFHTVGIPVEVEAGVTFTRVLGLNASAWAILNAERTVTGVSLGMVLGRLR
ncbi:MAG: hypothetical protein FIA95_04435 [Gemmatimonadetes bacterium]|nr:hypothetical protein [Gemmatimonadota bacterium]